MGTRFAIYGSMAMIVAILLVFAFILGANVAQPEGMKHWFERFQEFIAAIIATTAALGLGLFAWQSVQHQIKINVLLREEDKIEQLLPGLDEIVRFLDELSPYYSDASYYPNFDAAVRTAGLDTSSKKAFDVSLDDRCSQVDKRNRRTISYLIFELAARSKFLATPMGPGPVHVTGGYIESMRQIANALSAHHKRLAELHVRFLDRARTIRVEIGPYLSTEHPK